MMLLEAKIHNDLMRTIGDMDRAGLFKGASSGRMPKGELVTIYPSSWRRHEGGVLFMARTPA